MLPEIRLYLKELHLTDTETELYLASLSLGPSTILDISRYTNIKRTTVHFSIEKLIKKGFVKQTVIRKTRLIVAEDPSIIKHIVQYELSKLAELRDNANKIIRKINQLPKSNDKNSSVSYYKGVDMISVVYKQTLLANNVLSITNLDRYYKLFPGTRKDFITALVKNKQRVVKTIAVDSYLARQIERRKRSDRYETKFISEEFFSNADIHIYDTKIAIIDLDSKIPIATVIESPVITNALSGIHNMLWSIL